VETVMLRWEMPSPAGLGSLNRWIARRMLANDASGSPIPMKTMLLTRPGPPGISFRASARAPATTCSTISAVDRLRVSPAWPVAQNGQFIPQPACEETHIVTRSG
jgi:hypothetical protein